MSKKEITNETVRQILYIVVETICLIIQIAGSYIGGWKGVIMFITAFIISTIANIRRVREIEKIEENRKEVN